MEFWQIFGIVAVIAIIMEMLLPTFFFLNFAIAGIVTAIISIWLTNFVHLMIVFVTLSLVSLLIFRPLFLKKFKPENSQTGVENTYFGKIAKVIEPVTQSSGAISIFDERWEARIEAGEDVIPVGEQVKIVKNDSLVMYVCKL